MSDIEKAIEFSECPPGLFVCKGGLFFKSEYGDDAYCVSSGEYFWGGAANREDRLKLIVHPIDYETAEEALRAQAEREKGCEYCNIEPNSYSKCILNADSETGIYFYRDKKGKYELCQNIDEFDSIPATVCFNCGRQLKEDANK